MADIKQPRNLSFHNKGMALLRLIWDNSYLNMPFEKFRKYAVMKSGFIDVIEGYAIPKSIAFENMDDGEFAEVYNALIQFGIDHIGADRETIERELLNFI